MKEQVNKIIRHPLFSGSAVMILGSNAANALNYFYHLIVGRMLGPASYGELVSLISVIGFLGIIPVVLNMVVIKEISSAKNEDNITALVDWFKKRMFFISVGFSIIFLCISPFISSFLHINKISYFILITLILLFSIQSGFNRAILQGLLKFKEFVVSLLLENGSKLILTILLIYIGFGVIGSITAFLLAVLGGFYVTIFYLNSKQKKDKSVSPNIKSMLNFVLPVGLQTISITSLYTMDVILVKHFFSPHEAGIYASLSTLGKIIFFATGPIGSVMFPLVAKRKAQGKDFKKVFFYSLILTGIFSAGGLLVYWLFPKLVISLLYGSAYLGSEGLLVWFALFITLFTLSTLAITYNLSLGKTKVTVLPAVAAILQIILIILFHQTLLTVILISVALTALLLISLLIYSSYDKF